LRYLETAQLGLVAESLYERELLIKNAPDLVKRVPFYIPIYKHTSRRSWQVFIGLSLYALLGRLKAPACFRKLPHDQWHEHGLKDDHLQAIYQYTDAQTDDVQLTRAVMYSACQLGAELVCSAQFKQATINKNHAYHVVYSHQNSAQELTCRVLINATGPWHNDVQSRITPKIRVPEIELVQGAHIVIKQAPSQGVYYVESPSDQRAILIMPWGEHTLVGTTETIYQGDPADISPTEHEVDYLQNIVGYYFPGSDTDIVSQFAGARVLPKNDKSMFNRSRDTLYITDEALPGYVGLMGGKLTGYRSTAEKTMRKVEPYLSSKSKTISTKDIQLIKAPELF